MLHTADEPFTRRLRYNSTMITLARQPTLARRFGCAMLALLLAGCAEPGPADALQTYLSRLARTLDQPVPDLREPDWLRMPRTSDLTLTMAGSSLDALDFLALSGCAVQVTIGKRNSSLGRIAPPSQRLLLDLEYLQLAPECIAFMEENGDAALAATLTSAWQQKRAQLSARLFNATLASDEFRAFWRKPRELGDYPGDTNSGVITALESITGLARQWHGGDFSADNREFEILLSEVAIGDGGALLWSLSVQAGWLASANSVVVGRIEEGPLCSALFRQPEADILQTVVHKYFIDGVQPWSAALGRRHHELLTAIRDLEFELRDALPGSYRDWQQSRDSFIDSTAAAPQEHVSQLKTLLDPCQR